MFQAGHKTGLRTIALFEAAKGLLVLLAGLGLLSLVHHHVQAVAEELLQHFHLNLASRYPRIFLEAAAELTDGRLVLLAASAALYACFRFAEAYGLWYGRRWAEWLGVISGSMYVPVETYELVESVTWAKCVILFVNLAIVAYLVYAMKECNRIRV